jgi:predicted O-methyltransferase YrrM
MPDAFQSVLQGYLNRAADERRLFETAGPAAFARRDELLLDIGEDTARLLQALIIGRGAKRIFELGTSYGYSTLFLADAARRTGGRVTTFELSEAKQAYARDKIGQAGLADYVDWRCGDAVELLREENRPIDFVLIDLWKDLYVPCLEALYPKLADGAVLVADNMLQPEMARPDAEAYRAAVRSKCDLQSVLLPIGSGIELSCVSRAA